MKRQTIPTSTRISSVVARIGVAVALAVCSLGGSGTSASAATPSGTATSQANINSTTVNPLTSSQLAMLKGKSVLVVPFWLDPYGTAFGSWIKRDYAKLGVSVTLFNANADTSAQLNEIDTAIGSGQYVGVIWQPIDVAAAPTTVKAIQRIGMAQTLFNDNLAPGSHGVHVPQVIFNTHASFFAQGVHAANFIKAHPSLGAHPELAWLNSYPSIAFCVDEEVGLLDGLKSVDPKSSLAWFEGGASAADSQRKVADMITSGIKFNVFDGCGTTQSLAGYAALQAAGLSAATNKVPKHVYIMTPDGSPPELQLLWNPSSAMMVSGVNPPKDSAAVAVNQINAQLLKEIPITSTEVAQVKFLTLGTDCVMYRSIVEEQFQGVSGFAVPKCS